MPREGECTTWQSSRESQDGDIFLYVLYGVGVTRGPPFQRRRTARPLNRSQGRTIVRPSSEGLGRVTVAGRLQCSSTTSFRILTRSSCRILCPCWRQRAAVEVGWQQAGNRRWLLEADRARGRSGEHRIAVEGTGLCPGKAVWREHVDGVVVRVGPYAEFWIVREV